MIKSFRNKFFKIYQPLIKKPKNVNTTISDLFLWINNNNTKTYFNLINIKELFNEEISLNKELIYLKIYNQYGKEILTEKILINSILLNKIEINAYLKNIDDEFGLFAIFYTNPPKIFSEYRSFLSERGYLSYSNSNSIVQSFMHGNLDSIAMDSNLKTELLGCSGMFYRKYNLQYQFGFHNKYEIYVTNPTKKKCLVVCQKINTLNSSVLEENAQEILGGGVVRFILVANNGNSFRVSIKSKLAMARPVIVCRSGNLFDIFHG